MLTILEPVKATLAKLDGYLPKLGGLLLILVVGALIAVGIAALIGWLLKLIRLEKGAEKIKIPESREIIRVIRIKLGDEMTAAVGRAKIAKGKLVAEDATIYTSAESEDKSVEADPQ